MTISTRRVSSVIVPDSKLFIITEAPGKQEDTAGTPLVGPPGHLFDRICAKANICRQHVSIANVMGFHPERDNFDLFLSKTKGKYPPVWKNYYVDAIWEGEIARLEDEIATVKPNCILALGTVALWFCTWHQAITPFRGYVMRSRFGIKVVPSFHPAYMMRVWSVGPLLTRDYRLAQQESETDALAYPTREIIIQPTLDEALTECRRLVVDGRPISIDVETSMGMITCLAFSDHPTRSIVIPFLDATTETGSYWQRSEEIAVWEAVRSVLGSPNEKILQNGLFDIQYFLDMGLHVRNFTQDTMIMHHSLEPMMKKDLGFLGSLYAKTPPWKHLRRWEEAKPEE